MEATGLSAIVVQRMMDGTYDCQSRPFVRRKLCEMTGYSDEELFPVSSQAAV